MKKPQPGRILIFFLLVFVTNNLFSQAGNNTCATATSLGTLGGDCTSTAGDLYLANQTTNPTGSCSGGNRYDVWYTFTMPASSTIATITVTITSSPTSLANNSTFIEVFNTNNCTLTSTSLGICVDITSPRRFVLTAGSTYAFRIYVNSNPNVAAGRYNFNVCVNSNDNCGTATTITPGSTIDGNVYGASNSGVAVAPCTGTEDDDVWYKFTAVYTYATITLHNVGSSLTTSGPRLQLFSDVCGSLSSMNCMSAAGLINLTTLSPGTTYYIRVYSAGTGQAGFTATNATFRLSVSPSALTQVGSGRMKEIFNQQILSPPQVLADPWEITYAPDNTLWVTESKGYRLYRVNLTTGVRDTLLDVSQGSTFLSDVSYDVQFPSTQNPWPQGGFAGLAIHPLFPSTPYVYVSYVHSYGGGSSPTGIFFTNRLVQFTYNSGTGKLEQPVTVCDTLPGSNDHNSQRMIIRPMTQGGTDYYLFYGSGDMGAGQFSNRTRPNKAQNAASYEGKILRFNVTPDGDADQGAVDYNKWIPNTNPYNGVLGVQSAVYSTGIRNNQGFAYDSLLNKLYGSSHGPYSDDEINVIEGFKNYGHPIVIGTVTDGNYNGNASQGTNTSISAGAPWTDNSGVSSCPPVGNETTQMNTINAVAATYGAYKDPFFTAYKSTSANITTIWQTNPGNGGWPSEGWSGLDLYSNKLIPGWKRSVVAASLKWGRLLRLKLDATGDGTAPANTEADTVSYFGSINRFRDLTFAPNGKDIYVVMDRSTTTSGPSAANPVVSACQGCIQKYTFLGYADASGKSSIPSSIDVTAGTPNSCTNGTTITIDNTNNSIWVPITGTDGNIMAEIYANGNNLGTVTSSFYNNSGAIRIKNGTRYLDRNITITPQNQPSSAVKIRLYLSKAEFDALDADPLSGVSAITDLKILKNSDACLSAVSTATTQINPTFAEAHGSNGYMLQGSINSFSSFYFASSNIILPVKLITFTGTLQDQSTVLKWQTVNEINASNFVVERSVDGAVFTSIGIVPANNSINANYYGFTDANSASLLSPVLYYRLRIVDQDGSYTYSKVISISFTFTVHQYPNPVQDVLNIKLSSTVRGDLQIHITDMQGKTYYNRKRHVNNNTEVQIDCSKWPSQLYMIKVTAGEEVISIEKVLKL